MLMASWAMFPPNYHCHASNVKVFKRSYPLGSSTVAEIDGAAVISEGSGVVSVLMHDVHSKSHFVVMCNARKAPSCTLVDAAPRMPLVGAPLSCHALRLPSRKQSGASPECVAVVLQGGAVSWFRPSTDEASNTMQTIKSPNGQQAAYKSKAASSLLNRLAILMVPASSSFGPAAAHVQMFSFSDGGLVAAHKIHLGDCPPGSPSGCSPVGVHLARSYALVTWSSGAVSIVKTEAGPVVGGRHPVIHVDCSKDGEGHAPSTQAATAAAAVDGGGSNKKRRPGQPDGTHMHAPLPIVAPLDESQFIVARVESSSSPTAAPLGNALFNYVLVDSQFGCSISHGSIPLDEGALLAAAEGGQLLSRFAAQRSLIILELSGMAVSLALEAPRSNLLSLVGKISLQQSDQDLPVSGAMCVANMGALAEVEAEAEAKKDDSAAVPKRVPEAGALEATLAPLSASGPNLTSLRPLDPDHLQILRELEQSAPSSSTSSSKMPSQKQQKLLQRALQAATSPAPDAPKMLPALPALLSQRLAEAGMWDGLRQLLASASVTCQLPASCSWLLPAAARAQQYSLLAPLCCRLDELHPSDVVDTLLVLLTPTNSTNSAARRAHYAFVRCA